MDTRMIGMGVVELGGGRRMATDSIDYSVGFSGFCHIGDKAELDNPLAFVHAQTKDQADKISEYLLQKIYITHKKPQQQTIIKSKIGSC